MAPTSSIQGPIGRHPWTTALVVIACALAIALSLLLTLSGGAAAGGSAKPAHHGGAGLVTHQMG